MRFLLPLFLSAASALAAPTWTILIYGHGDHNLSPALVTDFLEMQRAGSSANFRIVLQTDFDASDGGTLTNGLRAPFQRRVTRWLVTPSRENRVTSTVLERLPELDSDRAQSLARFVSWGVTNFPADRYGLILWDHGGGWQGFGGDQQDGRRKQGKGLALNGILSALRNGMSGRLPRFDFLSFDACLMGSQEVLAVLHPLARSYIANAEIDYGDGWDYEGSLGWLKANPGAPFAEFAAADARAYRAHHRNAADVRHMAHASYDLREAERFVSAARAFAAQLRRHYDARVALARREAIYYDVMSADAAVPGSLDFDLVDVPDFARGVERDATLPRPLRRAARRYREAVRAMVVAEVHGTDKRGVGGVNALLPVNPLSPRTRGLYRRTVDDSRIGWTRVISAAQRARRNRADRPLLAGDESPVTIAAGTPVTVAVNVVRGVPYALSISAVAVTPEGRRLVEQSPGLRLRGRPGAVTFAWEPTRLEVGPIGAEVPVVAVAALDPTTVTASVRVESNGDLEPGAAGFALTGDTPRLVSVITENDERPAQLDLTTTTRIFPDAWKLTGDPREPNPQLVREPGTAFFEVQGSLEATPVRLVPLPPGDYEIIVTAEDAFGHRSPAVIKPVTIQ